MRKKLIMKGIELPYHIDEYGTITSDRNNDHIIVPYVHKRPNGKYKRPKVRYINKYYRDYEHRLVAEHFVPNPNPELYNIVNHIDGNTENNHYTNLEWTTRSGNAKHYYEKLKPIKGKNPNKNHRKIYQEFYGVKLDPKMDIHHIDGNHHNDDPKNMIDVTKREHGWLHRLENQHLMNETREGIRQILNERDIHNTIKGTQPKENQGTNGFIKK
jgi:hypothetical protein